MTAGAGAILVLVLARRRNKSRSGHHDVTAFYLVQSPDEDEIPFLESANVSPAVKLTWSTHMSDAPRDVNVFITRLPTEDQLDAWPTSLRHVVTPFAGPTPKTQELMRARPHLSLHNCHWNSKATAELAVGLLLAAAKSIVAHDQGFRSVCREGKRMWTPGFLEPLDARPTRTLAGRTALVLGYGACGQRVARALDVLGMQVLACRRQASPGSPAFDGVATVHAIGELHTLLPRAWALIVCLPGTAATTALIGAPELAQLPRGALLVNVGRGVVVEEKALFAALRDGTLAGAGIDVWYNYPMLHGQFKPPTDTAPLSPSSASCPFHDLPNVVMSPHRAANSDSKAPDRIDELVQMLGTLANTGELPNRFNIDHGY